MSIKQIEDRIRNAVNAKKVRCTEYFKDFDRLRTGYITSKIKLLAGYCRADLIPTECANSASLLTSNITWS